MNTIIFTDSLNGYKIVRDDEGFEHLISQTEEELDLTKKHNLKNIKSNCDSSYKLLIQANENNMLKIFGLETDNLNEYIDYTKNFNIKFDNNITSKIDYKDCHYGLVCIMQPQIISTENVRNILPKEKLPKKNVITHILHRGNNNNEITDIKEIFFKDKIVTDLVDGDTIVTLDLNRISVNFDKEKVEIDFPFLKYNRIDIEKNLEQTKYKYRYITDRVYYVDNEGYIQHNYLNKQDVNKVFVAISDEDKMKNEVKNLISNANYNTLKRIKEEFVKSK